MTPEEILQVAVEKKTPAERAAFLEGACGPNGTLRAQLEGLLQAHEEAGSFLEQSLFEPSTTVDEAAIAERPGIVIGPYKLVEQIGEGGFGVVFLAEQSEPVRRKLALKVLKPGMDTRHIVVRFEAERQALAIMDHPNIARVFDGGATASGRPYFVMELVEGAPITKYCDAIHLTLRQRLDLFVIVCEAVHHAHQKGVIHRDLKPSNILVADQDGKPLLKVIDFGVAKAIGGQLADTTIVTGAAQMIGTPLYMSPEQAGGSGLDIDTRTDIYSLGVLLYELLTGTTPFDRERFRTAGYDEIRRIIREEEAPAPSARLSQIRSGERGARHGKTGDSIPNSTLRIPNLRELDWIVMKALEKDRSRRYDTASAFAADVQRYLADEPVQACPPSAWYRYRKFARRHRFGLATAGVVMLLVVSLGGGIGWLVRDRGAREREITLDQEAREAALDLEVNRLLDEAGPLMEQENWPEALAAVERAEKLLASAGRGARPRLLVELQNDLITAQRLQEIYQGPSKFLKANSLLVEAEGNNRRRPPQLVSGEQEFFWGREQDSRFAQAFHDIGIDIHALAPAEAAARIASRRAGIRQALVRALDEWAPLRRRARGDNDPVWQKLIAIARQADPDEWRNRFREASLKRDRNSLEGLAAIVPVRDVSPATLWLLASQLMELGARDQAMAVLEEAHHHYPHDFWINDALGWFYWSRFQPPRTDDALRFYTATLALRPNLPNTHHAVGDVLIAKGATDDAIKEFSRAIELAPEDARGWSARGTAYYRASRWEKALADYSKAIELDAAVAIVWNNRGAVHNELHHFDKAVADLNRAIELDRNCVVAWINRGCAYRIMRRHEKAISDCTKAIELDRQLALGWCSRASAFSEMGQWDHAIADLNKAIELDPKYVVAWTRRGFAYAQLRQHEKGLADCSKAIELDPTDAGAWSKRGEVYNTMGLWGKAIADLGKAVELDPRHVPSWTSRGVAHIQLQQYEQGLADLSKAIDLDPTYARAWTSRGAAYNELNQYEKGLADCSRAIALDPKFAMGWNNRGYTYFCLKRYENAQADFSKAIELDPKYANAWANRALSNIYLQQYKDALADYSQAHELEPGSCEYQNQLAWLLVTLPHAELRDPKRALELSGQTVKRNPNNAAFLTTLGAARFRTGDWTGAAAALHEAEGLAQPGHGFDLSAARAMFFQAMAQHQLGNAKEARQAYDRALEWSEANRNAWQPALVEELRRLQAEAAELLGVKKN